ncbi:MAG: hypothetical protein ACPGTO_06480 [Polaribacter sp.]
MVEKNKKQIFDLSFEKIKRDFKKFSLTENDSYIETYPEFISYFGRLNIIEKHHLVISSHFVYGWMPTIIKINLNNTDSILSLLNSVKNGSLLSEKELKLLKECINNSLVGVSKLLHFINPNNYAIWDSRIYRYLTNLEAYDYRIGNAKMYNHYLNELKKISKNANYPDLHFKIESHFGYELTPMRAIEIVMFESDRKTQLKRKEKTVGNTLHN